MCRGAKKGTVRWSQMCEQYAQLTSHSTSENWQLNRYRLRLTAFAAVRPPPATLGLTWSKALSQLRPFPSVTLGLPHRDATPRLSLSLSLFLSLCTGSIIISVLDRHAGLCLSRLTTFWYRSMDQSNQVMFLLVEQESVAERGGWSRDFKLPIRQYSRSTAPYSGLSSTSVLTISSSANTVFYGSAASISEFTSESRSESRIKECLKPRNFVYSQYERGLKSCYFYKNKSSSTAAMEVKLHHPGASARNEKWRYIWRQ